MGKRRERRMAALMAAGRRVKLDLSTEPSGDTIGTSRHVEEVGGDLEQNPCARAPNSPSSPGQQQENPLTLLGQYSDDELEEEENKDLKPSSVDISCIDQDKLVEDLADIGGNKECTEGRDIASSEVRQEDTHVDSDLLNAVKHHDGNGIEASDFTAPCNSHVEADSAEVSSSGISCLQSGQDTAGGWKMVMHEESNRYYYWNTVTGETSWEIPNMLVENMEAADGQKLSPLIEESGSAPVDARASHSDFNVELETNQDTSHDEAKNTNLLAGVTGKSDGGDEIEIRNAQIKGENGQLLNGNPSVTSFSYVEAYALGDPLSNQQSSTFICGLEGITATGKEHTEVIDGKENNEHPVVSNGYAEASHSVELVMFGENLLHRLKSLRGSAGQTQAQDWRLKYILEIEIRLSDIKALALYGSSLLPFWWHVETKLKELEMAIREEASQFARHEPQNVGSLQISSSKDDHTSCQSVETKSRMGGSDNGVLSSAGNAYAFTDVSVTSQVPKDQVHHVVDHEDVKTNGLSSGFLVSEPVEIAQEAHENSLSVEPVPKAESHAGEDADMDVDMEVECETYAECTADIDGSSNAQPGQLIPPNANVPLLESIPSEPVEEFSAPPPPEEEWIPPPPPDNEPVPPPPPEEPPAPLYVPPPPPYTELAPLPYTHQYNFTYPVPTYDYYATTVTDVANATYYTPTESCQNAEPNPPPYYEPAANAFPEATTAMVNPVEPVVYYDLPSGAVPTGPTVGSLESSGFYSESGSVNFHDNATSDNVGSVGIAPESGYAAAPSSKVECNVPTSGTETDVVTVKSVAISTVAHITGTASANENSVAPLGSADAKNQPKVARSKKRTIAVAPTLRSNRKVSSLVDKWKAAKEELHGDKDDEPEDPLEVLEKKRQREIEEWRAQQIASGEARDNANFQPLGGDWRERVKRKKAESSRGSLQTSSELGVNQQQQPDLIELSKGLPSGWQAYWDESSKQVYYGNAVTSETTWTRPTR